MDKPGNKKGLRNLLFPGALLILYAVIAVVDRELAERALELSTRLLYQLLPVLVLVFFLILLSNLLLSPDWIKAHIGRESGFKGWAITIVGSMLSVGPVYPWYALLRDLRQKGMRTALVATFLYNRGIKLPLLPLMAHYFGIPFTLVVSAYLVLFSLLNGLIMEHAEDRGLLK